MIEWLVVYADWQVGAGEPNGFKSITAFYPEDSSNSNGTHTSFLMDLSPVIY